MHEDSPKHVELGPPDEFESYPAEVEIEGKRFFVGEREGEYVLLSSLCPHRGGPVLSTSDGLECPMHGWTFDDTSGEADGATGDGLKAYDVELSDGVLTATLSEEAIEEAHPARSIPSPEPEEADVALAPSSVIGDILDALGEPAIDLFHRYGFACLGCALADDETVRRAARRHHLSEDEMHDLLDQLRAIRDAG